jgi:hypothetical protein
VGGANKRRTTKELECAMKRYKIGFARLSANKQSVVVTIEKTGQILVLNVTELLEVICGKQSSIDILGNQRPERREPIL